MDMNDMPSYSGSNRAPKAEGSPSSGMTADFTFTTETICDTCKADPADKMKTTDSDHRV